MALHTGRHFLQIPGPTNVPDRVLRAMDMPTIDHRGPEFAELGFEVLKASQSVFRTTQPVIIFPSSGTGAWEAAIVNALSPGDKVLMTETGQFAMLWRRLADRCKLDVDMVPGDWRRGTNVKEIEARLVADKAHRIKAVMVVHNETSTSCISHIPEVRAAMDRAKHPALLMVDTVSGLGSLEYEHDAWGVDVSVSGSQKGLMLPPGLGFNAVSEKALAAAKANSSVRSYWDWHDIVAANKAGSWPYTPATNLLYGLKEAIHAARGGAGQCLRPPQAARRGHPGGGTGLGPRVGLSGAGGLFTGADRRDGAARARCRRVSQDRAGEVRYVARDGACQVEGQGVPHRPYRPL